jgi:hypothetical protein
MASSRYRRAANIVACGLALGLGSVSPVVAAATATGSASATVVGAISSVPIVIRFQQYVDAGSTSFGAPLDGTQGNSATPAAEPNSSIDLIGVDASGVVTFNVAGAATSNYVIRTPGGANSGPPDPADPADTTGSYGAVAPGQIFPADTSTQGKDLAIAISQWSGSAGGAISVMVNYN